MLHEKAELINEIKRLRDFSKMTFVAIGLELGIDKKTAWLYYHKYQHITIEPFPSEPPKRKIPVLPLKRVRVTPEMKAQFIEDYSRGWRRYD